MANGPARARFWKAFVVDRCGYPAPERLREQLSGAEFSDFCACGCNSFAAKVAAGARPLAKARRHPSGGGGAIYTADFNMRDGRTLEIILFADGDGNLSYIEVDCCANTFPVPDDVDADAKPFLTWAAELLPD